MSNQASADLEQENPDDFAGLADAGLGDGGAWEGREDAPSSATQHEAVPDDADAPDGSGREGGADEQEEDITALEKYWQTVEAMDLDNLPADPPAEEQPPVESAESEEDDDAEQPAEDGKAPQYRFRPNDEVEKLAFALRKADKSISIADAVDMARLRLGVTPAASAAPAAESDPSDQPDPSDAAPDPDLPSSADLHTQIVALRRQVLDAKEAYDVDAEVALSRQLLDLEEQLPQVRAAEQERQRKAAEADTAWEQALEASWQAVVAEYPAAAEENSAFAARMAEIDDAAREASEIGDPKAKELYDNPDKARVIARLVAKELGVKPASEAPAPAPVSKGRSLPAPASSRSSSPASRPGPAVVRPASGAARTAADSPTSFDVALSRVKTLEDYEVVKDQLLASLT